MTAVFAHRGNTDGHRENTLDAFAEAKRLGADGVELDVRLTADGGLAVHHDPVVPGFGSIAELRVPDLPPHVPLLADALAVCEGMGVNVEIKNDPREPGHDPTEAVAALVAIAIADAGWTDRVIVSSFQVRTLRAVQVADGQLALGALWPLSVDVGAALDLAAEEGWRAVHPFVSLVTPELVAQAHGAGLGVNVWTVNAGEDLRAMVSLQVDSVITDRLLDALAAARAGGV